MNIITKEAVESAIAQGATSVSGIWKAMGGEGNVSGSTTKKIRELVPDIQARLDANKAANQPVPATEPSKAAAPFS